MLVIYLYNKRATFVEYELMSKKALRIEINEDEESAEKWISIMMEC